MSVSDLTINERTQRKLCKQGAHRRLSGCLTRPMKREDKRKRGDESSSRASCDADLHICDGYGFIPWTMSATKGGSRPWWRSIFTIAPIQRAAHCHAVAAVCSMKFKAISLHDAGERSHLAIAAST